MALRDQPYLPLYVQDVLTDEKLIECSAESQGVYFRLMCILHKQPEYGKFLLKQKYKQNSKQTVNFAHALARPLAINFDSIVHSLEELIDEEVLILEGDYIIQKRMVKDADLSDKRAKAGKKGGDKSKNTNSKNHVFAQAKTKANTENEIDIENEVESENETELENEEPAEIRHFKQPVETVPYQEVVDYFHNACPELPKVTKLTDARKTHIRARLKDHGNEAMAEVFQKAGASHFLNGNNDRQFQANFDWLLNPNNFIKTLEGNYDNKERNSTSGKQGAISEELKREILASDFLKNA